MTPITIPSVFLVAAILVVLANFSLGVVSTTLPVHVIIWVVAAILVVLVLIPILIVLVRHRYLLADIEYSENGKYFTKIPGDLRQLSRCSAGE